MINKKISAVCDRLADAITLSRTCEADKIRASQIVDRVLKVISDNGEEGCLKEKFIPEFNLMDGEIDFAFHALEILRLQGVLRKEVRYFLIKEKNNERKK